MKTHKQIYMEHFDIAPETFVPCEVCGAAAVDVHHILFKSQQGEDEIYNLIALCRLCHDISHGKVKGMKLTREKLFDIIAYR